MNELQNNNSHVNNAEQSNNSINEIKHPITEQSNNSINEIKHPITEQSNNSINESDHPITAGFKFFSYLLESPVRTKYSLLFGTSVFIFIWLLILTFLIVMRPKTVSFGDIKLDAGTITLKDEDNTSKTLVLNPNGGTDSAWVDTQIQVEKGDHIKINATGKINLAVGRLINSAKDDIQLQTPWADPDGISPKYGDDPNYPEIKNYKIMKNQPFGQLIAGVKGKDGSITFYAIGKENDFVADKKGNLLLTVNDIWLSPENKAAYLPPESNSDYYKNTVFDSISTDRNTALQKTSGWNEEQWKQEIHKQYLIRKRKWDTIKNDRNYSLWYDDNVGAFAVTISIERVKN
ncbi:MAG: hypothetical protein KME29_08855 [Calothrix sp. FI2-JRJ7]|jgi:hypothetical protein|nr:hypothetical protein [Calothrix sp. FI2-JRJ7]